MLPSWRLAARRKPVFKKDDFIFLDRTELYRRALGAAMALPKLAKDHGLTPEDFGYVTRLLGFPLPIDLHFSMFVTTIRGQGDDEQQAYWLPKAVNFEIVGTYAQTEVNSGLKSLMPMPRLTSGPWVEP